MDIASYQKVSLQDYPEKISAICFTKGCNLRCPYCHNPDLVLNNLYSEKYENKYFEFLDYLNLRKNMLEGVVISGGEPLLHKDLEELIRKIKNLGLKIKLDTNGMFPKKLKGLIDKNLINYIALDYKGSSLSLNKAVGLKDTKTNIQNLWFKSLDIIIESKIDYELRTTVVKGIHNHDDLINMAKELHNHLKKPLSRWFLQSFEEKTDILGKFTKNLIPMTSYSKSELINTKNDIQKIIPQVYLRN